MVPDTNQETAESGRTSRGRSVFNRRNFLRASGVGVAGLTAGCFGGGDDGNGGTPTDGNGGTQTTRQVDGPLKVGVLAPLPGDFPGGTAIENASRLWAKEINSDGGLLGVDVEVIVKDTAFDPSTARSNYQELILQEDVDVALGLSGSAPGLAVIDEMAQHRKPFLSTGAATMEINSKINSNYDDYRYWFRILPNGEQMGTTIADYASEYFDVMGWQTIAVVVEDISGFDPIERAFLEKRPSETDVAFQTRFSSDTNDFSPILNRGSENDIDGMLSMLSTGGVSLETQWADQQPNFGLGGWDVFTSIPQQYENTEGAVRYIWSGIPGAAELAAPTPLTTEFINSYRSEYNALPHHTQAYLAYDGLLAWELAVNEVGTVDADEVVNSLEELAYEGTFGNIEWYPEGHEWVHDPMYGEDKVLPPVIQWQEVDGVGRQVGIWPDKVKNGEYQQPPWIE